MELKYLEHIHRVNDILSEIDSLYHEVARRLGLSDSALNILYCLAQLGDGCPVSKVYKRNGSSRQTVSSALRRMEEEELLYLKALDKKGKAICLTPKGQQLLQQKILPVLEMENSIFLGWQEQQVADYLSLNQKYLDDLRQRVKTDTVGA